MPLDKVLHKIQEQINDLAPMLEVFVEDTTIQPSVSDCEQLQKQMVLLQEQLAVYKYHKLNKEISPSFNLHAKVSAHEQPAEKKEVPPVRVETKPVEEKPQPKPEIVEPEKETLPPAETKLPQPEKTEPQRSEPQTTQPKKPEPFKQRQPLVIGLNDKFRFIKMLFHDNASEYNIAIEQLGSLSSWQEAESYLNSLKNVYGWKDDDEVVNYIYALVKKRFE